MRECFACGSESTYTTPRGYAKWYCNSDIANNYLCQLCYDKYINNPKCQARRTKESRHNEYLRNMESYKARAKRNHKRQITFQNTRPYLVVEPRIGVCSWCRAVAGIDCDATHMHHEKYDPSNPLAHTIEVCPSCHMRYTRNNR